MGIANVKMQQGKTSQGGDEPASASGPTVTQHVEKYLRIHQDAARLGVSVRTYAKWLAEKRIPYFKIGRCVLVNPAAVDEALKRFRFGPPAGRKRRSGRVTAPPNGTESKS